MLASPVANTRMPQASDRPTLELPAAGPTATGPFSSRVISDTTGACPMVHPVRKQAETMASVSRWASFFMAFLSSLEGALRLSRFQSNRHAARQQRERLAGPGQNDRIARPPPQATRRVRMRGAASKNAARSLTSRHSDGTRFVSRLAPLMLMLHAVERRGRQRSDGNDI